MASGVTGLIAVVTGSASGIGLATARLFHQHGATVYGFDLERGDLDSEIAHITCDVSSTEAVDKAFAEIETQHDHLDILVNCAGVGAIGTIEQASDAEWDHVLQVNVVGLSRMSARALSGLRKSSHAAIVNVGSVAATVGIPDRAVYTASKGAVTALTRAMAADHIADGIRVNCVNPGTADTPWVARLLQKAADPEAERIALNARQPMGRLVSADEVASAIVYLASPEQGSTTGVSLSVDGGMDALRTRARS